MKSVLYICFGILFLLIFSFTTGQPAMANDLSYLANQGIHKSPPLPPDTSGGPDEFGYTFKDSLEPDGPIYAWEDISATGTMVEGWTSFDDGYAGPIPIGFGFNYYGTSFDLLYVSTNGYISFGQGYGTIPWDVPPLLDDPNNDIALFGGDLYLVDYDIESQVYYEMRSNPTRFVLEFINIHWCCSYNTPHTFEVILYPQGDILAQYNLLNFETTSYVGIENADGSVGLGYGVALFDTLAISYAYPSGIFLNPPEQAQLGLPGEVITYGLTLSNQTGSEDSFTLAASGNTWPTTLSITQTEPISDNHSITFTVNVTVPTWVSPGDGDIAMIQATSVSSPSMDSNTAILETIVPSDQVGYVTMYDTNRLVKIDLVNQAVIDWLDLEGYGCGNPTSLRINPNGSQIWVMCTTTGSLVVIDAQRWEVITQLSNPSVWWNQDVAFTHNGNYALVSSASVAQIDVINTSTFESFPIYTSSAITHLAAHPYLPRIYGTAVNNNILVIDSLQFEQIAAIPCSYLPWGITTSHDGRWIYASSIYNGSLVKIDAHTNQVVASTYPIGQMQYLVISPDDTRLYALGNLPGDVYVIDLENFGLILSLWIGGSPQEGALRADGRYLYIGNSSDQTVVMDTQDYSFSYISPMPGVNTYGVATTPQHAFKDLVLYPPTQIQTSKPGETLTYTLELNNATGFTDTYNLSILPGNAWTTTLSTDQVGPLVDSEGITFTARVEIPSSVQLGEQDLATILATSVASPTVYTATASLSTIATSGEVGYVAVRNNGYLAIVDLTMQEVTGTIDLNTVSCYSPTEVAIPPDGSTIWVLCANVVVVIDRDTNEILTHFYHYSAAGIAFTHDSHYALVGTSDEYTPEIRVYDTSTYDLFTTITTPDPPTTILVHPYMPYAYTSAGGNGKMSMIDLRTFAFIQELDLGSMSRYGTIAKAGDRMYVSQPYPSDIAVIDPLGFKEIRKVAIPGNYLLEAHLDAAEDSLFVNAGWLGTVQIMDTATYSYTSLQISPEGYFSYAGGADATCDGKTLFISNDDNAYDVNAKGLAVVDMDSQTVTKLITMPDMNSDGYPDSGVSGIAICPQYVAQNVLLLPPEQTNPGGHAQVVVHPFTLLNATGITDTFTLELGSYVWDSSLSTDSIGPVSDSSSVTFTLYVTVPLDARWYLTDTVAVTATSITQPLSYTASAKAITQAYAPPQISFDPSTIESVLEYDQIETLPLTISNGDGVTLTYEILEAFAIQDDFSSDTGLWSYAYNAYRDATNEDVVLTNPYYYEMGQLWLEQPVYLSFDIEFNYWAGGWGGGDGFVLMFYKDSDYVPAGGPCLGFGADPACSSPGYGIEFDGVWDDDPSDDHIALIKDTVSNHLAWVADSRVADSQWHQARVSVTADSVSVWVDGDQVLTWLGSLDKSYNRLGFSAASGWWADMHLIDDVKLTVGDTQASWLSVVPLSGVLPADSSQLHELTFNAMGVQPGIYTTDLNISSNDPDQPFAVLPVTMTVNPTPDMGQVMGMVYDAWSGSPLTATVELVGFYSTTADPEYSIWATAGGYTLTAYTEGYYTSTQVITLSAGVSLEQDIGLEPARPRLEFSPSALEATLMQGSMGQQTLVLTNTGPVSLSFAFNEYNPARTLYIDIPWLSETPSAGAVPGHDSLEVTIGFDASDLSGGQYQAILAVEHNDPDQPTPIEIPVNLNVIGLQLGVVLTPTEAYLSTSPGETVGYSLTLTNLGNLTDSFTLEQTSFWTTTLSVTSTGELQPGEDYTFLVYVTIPLGAAGGAQDVALITARSTSDPEVSASAQLTTTAVVPPAPGYTQYLPLVYKY